MFRCNSQHGTFVIHRVTNHDMSPIWHQKIPLFFVVADSPFYRRSIPKVHVPKCPCSPCVNVLSSNHKWPRAFITRCPGSPFCNRKWPSVLSHQVNPSIAHKRSDLQAFVF